VVGSVPVRVLLVDRNPDVRRGVEGIARDVTDRLREEDDRRRQMLRAGLRDERERITLDLHDGVIGLLNGVGMSLRSLAGRGCPLPCVLP